MVHHLNINSVEQKQGLTNSIDLDQPMQPYSLLRVIVIVQYFLLGFSKKIIYPIYLKTNRPEQTV